jgi:nicotinamide mononucleotide (NMN) deamidase PncC
LTERQIAVAILETNTGGVIARALAAALPDDAPAGLVTGSTSADLPSPLAEEVAAAGGGYSEALALRVAEQIAAEAEADYGLAILGSAGEDQGIYADRPGETYLALVGPGLAKARRLAFGGRDQLTQLLTGNRALLLLWRALRD